MTRRYESPVRAARVSETRNALLDAALALLSAEPPEDLTLPAVARRAGVTKPTAYSHFPDQDALMAAVYDHVRARIGMSHEGLAALSPEALPGATRANYRRFEADRRLVLRLMSSPSYERARLARDVDRAGLVLPAWRARTGLPARVLRERLGALYLLLTPASWRWLTETWGLDGEGAARASAWAVEALVRALDAPRRARPAAQRPAVRRAKKPTEKERPT